MSEQVALRSAHRVSLTDEQAAALLDRYAMMEAGAVSRKKYGLKEWFPPSPLAREALELLRMAKDRLRKGEP